jgi:hypothetical protein
VGHYESETCLTGGYLCGHRHATREDAERCLPEVPPHDPGALTRPISMARVLWEGDDQDPEECHPPRCDCDECDARRGDYLYDQWKDREAEGRRRG